MYIRYIYILYTEIEYEPGLRIHDHVTEQRAVNLNDQGFRFQVFWAWVPSLCHGGFTKAFPQNGVDKGPQYGVTETEFSTSAQSEHQNIKHEHQTFNIKIITYMVSLLPCPKPNALKFWKPEAPSHDVRRFPPSDLKV